MTAPPIQPIMPLPALPGIRVCPCQQEAVMPGRNEGYACIQTETIARMRWEP